MCRRKGVGRRQDVLCDGIKDTGIVSEYFEIEDLLRILEAKMRQLRVETSAFGSEVRNPKACRYLPSSASVANAARTWSSPLRPSRQ